MTAQIRPDRKNSRAKPTFRAKQAEFRGLRRSISPKPALKYVPGQNQLESPCRNDLFRILIAVHRPRYRVRAEQAVAVPGWEIRSLLNKEDPIGLLNQNPPHILIISDDFGHQKALGILRAAQKYRSEEMKVIGLFESAESLAPNAELFDSALAPPWKTADLRTLATQQFLIIRGEPPEVDAKAEKNDDNN